MNNSAVTASDVRRLARERLAERYAAEGDVGRYVQRIMGVELRGAMAELGAMRDTEVLLDGPAGTGKTWAACCFIAALCKMYPGVRVLLARKTRTSMSQSILVTWERVLPLVGASVGGASRTHRTGYQIGGSEVVCYGFDDSERIKSSEYDVLMVNEATELTLEDWEIATSRLRNGRLGWHLAMCDCNPGAPSHWLNRRAESGVMRRLRTTHEDNPLYHDGTTWTPAGRQYLERLERLTGVRHKRLRLGIWCAAEGIVYAEYDPAVHIIDKPLKPIESCVVGVDWGYRDPGVMQVWGTDSDKRMYRIHEVYRTGQTIDWWVEQARRIQTDYKPRAWLPDPSEPGYIEQLRRAVEPLGGNVETWAQKRETPMEQTTQAHHPKDIRYGIDIVAARLRARPDGTRGIYWLRGAVAERDPVLAEKMEPTCSEEEIENYVYEDPKPDKPPKEVPKAGYDHGCDATRYCCVYLDGEPESTGAVVIDAGW